MPYTAVDVADVEPRRGGEHGLRQMRRALGVSALGINYISLPPNSEGPEHDESTTGQEEVYVILSGDGVLRVAGDELPLVPGRWIFVAPGTPRQVVSGDEGVAWLCAGAVPGGAYVARDPF